MLIEKLLDGLEAEAIEHARQALLKPKTEGDMTFNYGSAVGFQKGLEHALAKIKEIYAEDRARERIEEPTEFD